MNSKAEKFKDNKYRFGGSKVRRAGDKEGKPVKGGFPKRGSKLRRT